MNIEMIDINKIKPDKDQPRKHFDEDALERLVTSIKDNGIESPIIVKINGNVYMIVDGERRWKASSQAGLKEMPCIITDNEDRLEMQLRSDCLKEGLTTNDLDKAIYKYYSNLYKQKVDTKKLVFLHACEAIGLKVGKSFTRVEMAIDRFDFKRKNKEFTDKIKEKYNPENKPYSKVNSTIAMTRPLKKKPEVRKAVIEKILDDRKSKNFMNNEQIKEKVKKIASKSNIDKNDVPTIYDNIKTKKEMMKDFKNDPKTIFADVYFDFGIFNEQFMKYEFDNFKEHIQGDMLKAFIKESKALYEYLKKLEVSND